MSRSEQKTRSLRADAARNRAAILQAASRVFDEFGFDTPMSKIAQAAGVGRTTLLRNFPTRMDIATALFEQVLTDIRTLVASQQGQPEDLEEVLDLKLDFYIRHGGMAQAFYKANSYSKDFEAERNEVANLLLQAAQPGIKSGLLRSDLTTEVFVILQKAMSGALLGGTGADERRQAALILKALFLEGIRNRQAQ